jgi:predicted site-specific integrase-resolvase
MTVNVSKPLRTHQLAAIYGVHENTISSWRRAGKIPYMRAGRVVLYDFAAVQKAMTHLEGVEIKE